MFAKYKVKQKLYTGLIVAETSTHVVLLTPKKGCLFRKKFKLAEFKTARGLEWLSECPIYYYKEVFDKIASLLKSVKLTKSRRSAIIHLVTMESILHQANKWLHDRKSDDCLRVGGTVGVHPRGELLITRNWD